MNFSTSLQGWEKLKLKGFSPSSFYVSKTLQKCIESSTLLKSFYLYGVDYEHHMILAQFFLFLEKTTRMISIVNLEKYYRTEEVETVALNKQDPVPNTLLRNKIKFDFPFLRA